MNLMTLRANGDWPFSIDLHHRINVLLVPDADRRERLREIFAGIMRGELTDLSGSLAVDGTDFDLERDAIEILGIPADISLTLTAADLPGAVVIESSVDEAVGQASDLPSDEVDDGALDAAHAAVDEARRQLDEARQRATDGDDGDGDDGDGLARAQAELDRARAHLHALHIAPDRPDPEPEPEAEVAVPSPEDDEVARLEEALRQAEDERRVDEIKLSGLPEPPSPAALAEVESRWQTLRQAEEAGPQPSADALALAERWAELQDQLARAETADQQAEPVDHPVKRALDEARVELTRAEHGARPLYVTPDTADELDRAHAAVAEAEDRAFRRLAGPLAKRRLESAKEVEAQILKRIGVSSYDSYLMQSSPGLVDADAQQQLIDARRRVAESEAAWQAVLAEGHEPTDDFDEQVGALRSAAAGLLGHRPDDASIEGELRAHTVVPDLDQMRANVLAAVEAVGGRLETADDEAVESWLKSARESEDERAELRRVLALLDRRVDELVRELDLARERVAHEALTPGEADGTAAAEAEATARAEADRASRQAAVTAAEEALAVAEREAEERRTLQHEIEQLESTLQQAEGHLADVTRRVEERPAAAAPPSAPRAGGVDVSGVGAKDAELYVLARIAAQRAVGDAGPLPLIIDEAFVGFPPRAAAPVFDLLSRMSGIVQIIYLTADDAVREWAERLGPEEATIFRFASAHPSP
jgi:hypothetical protein